MKIGLINLPKDANYGGNLQRFALVKTLQKLGNDVFHYNLVEYSNLPWFKKPYSYTKRIVKKYIFGQRLCIFQENLRNKKLNRKLDVISSFYNRYIPHTEEFFKINDFKKIFRKYKSDVVIVGSDQVWRKSMTGGKSGLSQFMLSFINDKDVKKIAYSVSLGTNKYELDADDSKYLFRYYKQFSQVSVREDSAIDIFLHYGWCMPEAKHLLDPTFLLTVDEYNDLIDNASTQSREDEMFCYILDINQEKENKISELSVQMGLSYYIKGIDDDDYDSIEQWLRNIRDAKFIVTDSYHGLIFSLIYNKPFYLFRNEKRGNARFDSIVKTFKLVLNSNQYDWQKINSVIQEQRQISYNFIKLI